MRLCLIAVMLVLGLPAVDAEPIDRLAINVVDGDTITAHGTTYRLVGFDAPESYRAKCSSERDLGNKATFRLRQLIADGGLDLERVGCSCRPGTEETMACNYGRRCGVLRVRGKDAAEIMIGEGLARSYVCTATRCPKRDGWCG
jgi:endonuclease YncB( thermonuclease family)